MSRYALTVTGDTLDELYSTAAHIADVYYGRSTPAVAVKVSDVGQVTASLAPVNVPAQPAEPGDDDGAASADAPAFDKAGTPWDKRIHSSSKAINEDGTWRKRRNLADITYTTVMAELAQQTPGALPAAPPVVPSTPAVPEVPTIPMPASIPAVPASPGIVDQGPIPVPTPAVVSIPPVATPVAIPAAPVAAVPAVPEAAPVAVPSNFGQMMVKVAEAMKAGKFTSDQLNAWVTSPAPEGWGMANINQFSADPAKTDLFLNWLRGAGLVE
jgi:hypothetical protein